MASQINFKGEVNLIHKIQKFIKAKRICDNVLEQIKVNLIDQNSDIQAISNFGDEQLKQQIEKEMPNKTIEQLIIIPTSIKTYTKEVAYPFDIANIHFGILVDNFPAIVSDTVILKENKQHPKFNKFNGLGNNVKQIIEKITQLLKPGTSQDQLVSISRIVAQEHGCELIGDTIIYKVHEPSEDVSSTENLSEPFLQEEVIKLNQTFNLNLCLSFEQTDQNEFADFQFTDFIRAHYSSHSFSKRQLFLFSATYYILKNGPAQICGFTDSNFKEPKALFQDLFERMKQLIYFLCKRMRKITDTIEVLERKPLVGKKLNQYNFLFQQVKNQIIKVRKSIVQTINKHNYIKIIDQQIKPIVDSFFIQLDKLEQYIQVLAQNFDKNNIKEKQDKRKQQLSEIELENQQEQNKCNLKQSQSQIWNWHHKISVCQLNLEELKHLERVCLGDINVFNYFGQAALSDCDFDPQHNRKWSSGRQIIERRGPSYHPYYYYPPMGYFCYALNVKNKYIDNEKWLDRYGDDGEWRILYHGTQHIFLKNIVMEGLIPERSQPYQSQECELTKQKVGKGVYFSDKVEVCEPFAKPTHIGDKKYILVLQSRVNPRAIRQSQIMKQLRYFAVNESKDIRTYKILLKEIS